MAFLVRWTGPGRDDIETVATAKAAMALYVEKIETGYTRVEVRDEAGRTVPPDELKRLAATEPGAG